MQVQIVNVQVDWVGEGRKKYGAAVVDYKWNGESRKQKIMSFANPDVFKKVQEMVGQTVEVETGKNDRGYNEWRNISQESSGASGYNEWRSINVGASDATGVASPGATNTTRVSGSNYETKEERAARQVLIVKQSSLSAAVASLTPGAKATLDPATVLERAQAYTDWVFGNGDDKQDASGFDSMKDDIPY